MTEALPQTPAKADDTDVFGGVVVIGGGFAGLCAALAARQAGAQVMLLDAAPPELRGGNTRHCRNIRLAHTAETPWLRGSYPAEAFTEDLVRMGTPDPALAAMLADRSAELGPWLADLGVRFERWDEGNLPYSRRTAFLRGGGQALTNGLYRAARQTGVEIHHGWRVTGFVGAPFADGPLRLRADTPGGARTVTAAAVVLASGGYGADTGRMAQALGPAAGAIANRGTPRQRGEPLLWLMQNGVATAGLPGDGHLVAVDARAPMQDAGIVSRLDGMHLGLVVDAAGRRFRDEGAAAAQNRYSAWGRALGARDDPRAWLVLSAEAASRLPPMLYPPLRAETPAELAGLAGIDGDGLEATLTEVNAHLAGGPAPQPPRGLSEAAPLAPLTGPLMAYPMRPGLSFTRHGLAVDAGARVRLETGAPAPRLFAAGAAMCGAVLGQGYLSGTALTIGGVFGRIAGENAARMTGTGERVHGAPPPPETRGQPAPPSADPETEARRTLNICNTCGFCTGLCDVFPAAQMRAALTQGDLRHLAHLCHDCRSCHYDCQYAPPHDLAVNLPAALADMRAEEYRGRVVSRGREPDVLAALFVTCLLGLPLAVLLSVPPEVLFAPQSGPGAFYAVIPHGIMSAGAMLAFGGAAAILIFRVWGFWRAGAGPAARIGPRALWTALRDVLTLRNLGGGPPGCEDRDGPTGAARRWAHHLLAYGFGLTFLATVAGAVLHRAGEIAPYPLASAPVILGTVGGVAMLVGLAGLEYRRRRADRRPAAAGMERADRLLRGQLAIVAATGLALLGLRETGAMGLVLALHLGSVLGLAICLPFGKLSHGAYRAAALLRQAGERAARRGRGGAPRP